MTTFFSLIVTSRGRRSRTSEILAPVSHIVCITSLLRRPVTDRSFGTASRLSTSVGSKNFNWLIFHLSSLIASFGIRNQPFPASTPNRICPVSEVIIRVPCDSASHRHRKQAFGELLGCVRQFTSAIGAASIVQELDPV